MKKPFLISFIFISISWNLFAQCNCETINKENVTIKQCNPLLVGGDKTLHCGIALGKTGNEKHLSLTIRFIEKAMEVNSKITIWLQNGNSIDISLFNGGLAYVGNSQIAQAIYKLDDNIISKLKDSKIKTIAFTLTDGLRRTYEVKTNSDVIIEHLKCL